MRRFTLPALVALCVPALVGCPPPMTMGTSMMPYPNSKPMPYPSPMPLPMMTSAPGYPVTGYPVPQLVADGPSMDDAYHYVQRYVAVHYPGAEVVAIRSSQVGQPGRISKAGAWSFTYRMPVTQPASGSTSTQAVDIPSQFESRQLTFTLNGNNQLFAPEAKEKVLLQPLDYARVIPLGKALEACQGFGMAFGPGGVSAALVCDSIDGAYYEIDNSIGYQWVAPSPGPYGSGSIGGYAPSGFVRGKYRIDAQTGNLLATLSNP